MSRSDEAQPDESVGAPADREAQPRSESEATAAGARAERLERRQRPASDDQGSGTAPDDVSRGSSPAP